MTNQLFNQTIQNFDFSMILKNEKLDQSNLQKIANSEFIIIDTYIKNDEKYIIACLDRQLLISELINEPIISTLFSEKNINKISFVSKIKVDFLDENLIKSIKSNENQDEIFNFNEEVDSLIKSFQIQRKSKDTIRRFWNIINPCISAYLIKKNYIEFDKGRAKLFFKNIEKTNERKIYKEEDFIILRQIRSTETSVIDLGYHIESENIYVIKHFSIYQKEIQKLTFRELNNYEKLKNPFIPRFYGKIQTNERISLVIEFIKGKTLNKLNINEIIYEQKLMIIIELLFIFRYLHRNKFIYRDLKPDNLIIDKNNNIVLIDFDRMIYYNRKNLQTEFTADLNSPCLAPELSVKNYIPLFENDIYSIGKMICYILTEKFEFDSEFRNKYPDIYSLIKKCCSENAKTRPPIDELICFFDTLILNTKNSQIIKNIEINISLLIIADYYSRYNDIVNDYDAKLFIYIRIGICIVSYENGYHYDQQNAYSKSINSHL